MSSTCMLMISLFFLISPIACHRLITGPTEVQTEWDSVVVSSDPIKITNKKHGVKANKTKSPDYAIRFNHNTLTGDKVGEASSLQGRSFKDCQHNDIKCLYDNDVSDRIESTTSKNNDIINKFLEQYSTITNVKFNQEEASNGTEGDDVKASSDLKKSYWNLVNSEKHNHPYDDKKGWVTLEPVPWSSSKVSKWQSNVQPSNPPPQYGQQQPNFDSRPWNYGPSQRPTTAHLWVTNRPSQDADGYQHHSRPSSHFPSYKPVSHWGLGTNDIITDNRPSDFPAGNGGYSPYQKPDYHLDGGYHQRPWNYPDHLYNSYPGNRPSRHPTSTGHPTTYPDEGNGEWVLLSTTKGYSLPQRYRDSLRATRDPGATSEPTSISRNMKLPEVSRYHEENIDDKYVLVSRNSETNRKSGESVEDMKYFDESSKVAQASIEAKTNVSWDMDGLRILRTDNGGGILAAAKDSARSGKKEWAVDESPLQMLEPSTNSDAVPVTTYKRTVRLTVLPPLKNTSTTSHGGLLEVDSNFQSVEEAQKEEERLKKLSELANVKSSRFGQYTMIPVPMNRNMGSGMSQRSASVLAAVGAGMIPATMAVLVPMALGRKRRSIELTEENSRHLDGARYRHVSSW